jgi:cyclophilin family peptidyl-prolyl cis-trans isomerase
MDIEAIRKEILPDNVRNATKLMGNGFYPVNGVHKIRVKNGVVITVLSPKMKLKRTEPTRGMTTRNKALRKKNRRKQKREAAMATEYEQYEDAGLI